MKNPFDQNFFRFLLGFSFILCTSFAVLFMVGQYSTGISNQEVKVLQQNKK